MTEPRNPSAVDPSAIDSSAIDSSALETSAEEERVLALLRDATRLAVSESADRAGRHQLLMRVRSRSHARAFTASKTRPRRLAMALSLCAIVSVAAVVLWQWPRPLSYEVAGAVGSGDYLSAPAGGQVEVRFSDGSLVRGLPGSRLRIAERTARGARVSLERGETRYEIVHRPNTEWSVAAGPFEVRVTGTRFELDWDPELEVLSLRVRQGSVEVAGPMGATPIAVRAGQGLQGDVQSERLTVFSLEQATAWAEPSASAIAPEPHGAVAPDRGEAELAVRDVRAPGGDAPVQHHSKNGASAEPGASRSWQALVASGDFDAVVRAARALGVERCLNDCSSSDLSALGDAARYSGQTQLALSALERSYQRFGSSNSAFLMGRTLESGGDLGAADKWYQTYLSRFPSGGLAAEALAGRMRAVRATRGRDAAVPLARQYLLRYPSGVHTKTAHRILEER
jgi:ferric-dicitrate binding protein FerR (iron transport regulator)